MTATAKLAPFNWEDPLLLEQQLIEQERMVRDSTYSYCREQLLPRVLTANREQRFDRGIMHKMGELGLLGSTQLTAQTAPDSTTTATV